MSVPQEYDVVIVGASIAGSTTAILLAQRGARVALIEQQRDWRAYKKVCGHFIQASATPLIERIGLASRIEAAGGLRNYGEFWAEWGWIRPPAAPQRRYGHNIRRETLDPIIRTLAAETPGVDLMLGYAVDNLLVDRGRPIGVRAEGHHSKSVTIGARLVVGADGRSSRIAQLANMPKREWRNGRFTYLAYHRDLPTARGAPSHMWLLNPDVAYACPNDDGVTMLAAMVTRDKRAIWKSDIEGNFVRMFCSIPGAPPLSQGRRISPFIGAVGMSHIARTVARPGLALVGDAALAAGPLWGVGCGWAFQSSGWLADCVGDALDQPSSLDNALRRYRNRHRWELGGHAFLISRYASGRRFNVLETLILAAAARNSWCAGHLAKFADRTIGASQFLAPTAVARAIAANVIHLSAAMRTQSPRVAHAGRQESEVESANRHCFTGQTKEQELRRQRDQPERCRWLRIGLTHDCVNAAGE